MVFLRGNMFAGASGMGGPFTAHPVREQDEDAVDVRAVNNFCYSGT